MFMTIASSVETTGELKVFEVKHMCPEKALAQLVARERSIEAQAQRN